MLRDEFGQASTSYWCSLCGVLHAPTPGSEEQIMKTGWRTHEGVAYNVGFCNGTHNKNATAPQLYVRPAAIV